jgi:hypothetical protein
LAAANAQELLDLFATLPSRQAPFNSRSSGTAAHRRG